MPEALDWTWSVRRHFPRSDMKMDRSVDFRRFWKVELFLHFMAASGMTRTITAGFQQAMFPVSSPESQREQFSRYKNDGRPKSASLHQSAAQEMNAVLARAAGVPTTEMRARIEAGDLETASLLEFTRKLGEYASIYSDARRAFSVNLQTSLIGLLSPKPTLAHDDARLRVVRYAAGNRFTTNFSAPDESAPDPFRPGDQMEVQLSGVPSGSLYVFTFIVRDALLADEAVTTLAWKGPWGDIVRWAGSPQRVAAREGAILVPKTAIVPLTGRYDLTVMTTASHEVADLLAPSGSTDKPTVLSEDQHLQFLRTLADVAGKKDSGVSVLRAGYVIQTH
jgi:protein involved in polysaccharide export with SLBB domain